MGFPFEETLSSNLKTQTVIDDDNELGLMAVRLANAAAFPMVLKASLELGVFDTLYAEAARTDAFLSPSEIASRLPTTPRNPEAPVLLDRMLRLLASYSMVKCDKVGKGERVYRAEPICRFFLKDNIQDIGSLAAQLKDVVLEGGDAFGRAHGGMKLFDYMGTDERFSKLFNQTGFTIAVVKKALEVYQGFKDVDVLVDVGGGVGNTLGVVTSKYPNIKGINFDLTCALAQAPTYPGVEHVAGDMFVEVPKGDAMILKRILHDWTDEDCIKILKNCWKSLPENGKVVVIELVTPDDAENGDINANIAFDMDMLMFTQCSGGKERSRAEFEALAVASGFTNCKFVCQAYHCWIIEFCKENVQVVIDDDNELGLMAVRLANAAAFPMVLKAALELGVFDTLYAASVFLSPSEIASRLPTTPRNPEAPALLDRMLRLLASYSVVKCGTVQAEKDQRVYKAEPICRAQLKDVVLEGGDAFGRAHGGMKLFDYMGTDERFSKLFNQTGFTIAVVKKALEVYQGFKDVDVLVDVGGGVGNTLGVVTSKYPNIKGINFDLTCALAQAPSYPGVEHVAGDMFVEVPKGDTMILKRILHDWTDEDCSGDINSNIAFDMDMLMFTQCSGGKERSRAEFEALAMESGFTHCKFVCQAYHCWIIEFCKENV
ncbi:hypothetical protein HID58_030666 [Brassica napus]|uniref:Uncharacterized protein n=1 Tax=Brassica napus TaxID=3708 RepID=A0ABQ8CGM2_BRANA|nr:hypothetical protein HID58_030666 [Brassica napus]